jgi:ketosteroid isomerase-like protein
MLAPNGQYLCVLEYERENHCQPKKIGKTRLNRLSLFLFIALAYQTPAFCWTGPAVNLVREYLQASNGAMQLDATERDIEKVLTFCADDFVYEHPAVKAKIEGKDKVRAGMAGYLGFTKNATYRVRILASNKHVVITKVERKFLTKQDDGGWKSGSRTNITIFEIENGKISRILDY